MACETITGSVYEDSTFSLMARFEVDGANATQADCSSITIKAWDMSDFGTQVLSATLVVADVVFDALQTDGRWSEDSTGYNFRYDVADTVCTVPGARYRFESVVTTSGGKLPPMVWEVLCLKQGAVEMDKSEAQTIVIDVATKRKPRTRRELAAAVDVLESVAQPVRTTKAEKIPTREKKA
jgi:hypothetical protein